MKTRDFYIIGFGVLMAFDTLMQVSVKLASSHSGAFVMNSTWFVTVLHTPWLYGAIVGYLGAFVVWMTLLKRAPVGPAFAASHMGMIPVLAISVSYFGEHLHGIQVLGVVCIVLGIAALSLSEAKNEAKSDEAKHKDHYAA
jgi:multidrug transporter EmrE-like cation transporter